jgi:glucosylceramidase
MNNSNRRTFLKLGALAASATASRPLTAWTMLDTPSGASMVKAWRTSGEQRYVPIEALMWRTGAPTSPMSIRLDPDQRYQQVLGFGAALTDASCYLLEQLDVDKQTEVPAQ